MRARGTQEWAPRGRAARRRGLSLVEVLVAGTGTVLMMGFLFGAMSGGTRAVKRSDAQITTQSQALMGVERMFAALRLSHSASVTVVADPPVLAFLAADRTVAPPATPLASSAYALRGLDTAPLAWKRFLVFHYDSASRELRCAELPYESTQVASLHPEWLASAVTRRVLAPIAATRLVEAVEFGRNRPPGVDIDLTVTGDEAGQKQETRLKLYVSPRNG